MELEFIEVDEFLVISSVGLAESNCPVCGELRGSQHPSCACWE
jgi:hypothetical protein